MDTVDAFQGTRDDPQSDAWWLFAAINASAFSLACIITLKAGEFGFAPQSDALFRMTLLVTACVALPISAIVAQHRLALDVLHEALRALAPTDALTGLLNRRFFELTARDELKRMERTGAPCAIAVVEVDHLDRFNRQFGKRYGDNAVREVSALAHQQLRGPFDRLGRWQDDQLIILLSDVSMFQAEEICERLRIAIDEAEFFHKGRTSHVTASFGVAPLQAGSSLEDAAELADAALKEARRFGRNQVRAAV